MPDRLQALLLMAERVPADQLGAAVLEAIQPAPAEAPPTALGNEGNNVARP